MEFTFLAEQFSAIYHTAAEGVASAPGRVNLIGEHTDYNDGFVLPCTLNFRTKVLFKARADNIIKVHSLNYPGESDCFSVAEPIKAGPSQWGNYVRAVAFVLQRAGHKLCGADLLIESDVPQGAGLSSSAALEVAVGGMFNSLAQLKLTPTQIALFGQQAENDFMDCQCGIMDQLVSANGQSHHALLIDCQDLSTQLVAMPTNLVVVIINSNYPRKLVDSEYNQRRLACEAAAKKLGVSSLRQTTLDAVEQNTLLTDVERKRARHVVSENLRVIDAVQALQAGDLAKLRTLMAQSHQSLHRDYEVTVPATDG
ncbi:MAG: galactokinase, partial [Paraglaciecola sp.]|nr:galactokinase [Paraglaciecola sp.]